MSHSHLPAKNILVYIDYDGQWHEVITYPNEYRSLMMLIYDRVSAEGFGDCLGMGKCATCQVEVILKKRELSTYERNEASTLLKTGVTCGDIRLSCQLMIDEQMDGLVVKVLT